MQHQIASEVSNAFHSMFDDFLKGLFEGLGVIANTMWPDKSKEIEERIARVVAAILKRQEERRKTNVESQSKIAPLVATTADLHDITDGKIPAVDTYKLSEDPVRKVGIIEARLANGKATTLEVQRGDSPSERLMHAAIAAAQNSINSGVHTVHITGPRGCDGHIFDEAGRRLTNQDGGALTVSRGTDAAVKWDKSLSATMPGVAQPAAKVAAAQTAAGQVQAMDVCLVERERLENLMALTAMMDVAKVKCDEAKYETLKKEFADLLTEDEKANRIEEYNKKAEEYGRPSFDKLPVEHMPGTGTHAPDQSTYFEPCQYWTDVIVEKGEANNAKIEAGEHVVENTESETLEEKPEAGEKVAQSEAPREEGHAVVEPVAVRTEVKEVDEEKAPEKEPQTAEPEAEATVAVKEDPMARHLAAFKAGLIQKNDEVVPDEKPKEVEPVAANTELKPTEENFFEGVQGVAYPGDGMTASSKAKSNLQSDEEAPAATIKREDVDPVAAKPTVPEAQSEVEAPKADKPAEDAPVAVSPEVKEAAESEAEPAEKEIQTSTAEVEKSVNPAEEESVAPAEPAPAETPVVEKTDEEPTFSFEAEPAERKAFSFEEEKVEQVQVEQAKVEAPRPVQHGPTHGCIRK